MQRRGGERGSFVYRWEMILKRLDQTDAGSLAAAIRNQFTLR